MAEPDTPAPAGSSLIGIIYNIKREDNRHQAKTKDAQAEYDERPTILAIQKAINKYGCRTVLMEADADLPEKLRRQRPDLVFNIAEGTTGRGREAQVPSLLELLGIPYTGSDPAVMAVALDKALCKRIAASFGIRTPAFAVVSEKGRPLPDLRYPVLIKPNAEGSSKGINELAVARDASELRGQLDRCLDLYGEDMLVEEFLPGREFTVGTVGNGQSLRIYEPMEISYHDIGGQFPVYSYEVKREYKKYISYHCPADIGRSVRDEMMRMAATLTKQLGIRDLARFDFRLDSDGRPNFIEANPLPGLAPGYSDYPMLCGFSGVSYDRVVISILEAAASRADVALSREPLRHPASFSDWHWQLAHRARNAADLAKLIKVPEEERREIDSCLASFRMAVTPYYASLIDQSDPNDPIRRQCVPSVAELEEAPEDLLDPLNEDGDSPTPGLVHRYPDRVLLLVTLQCSMYCRHCTRRRLVGEEDRALSEAAFQNCLRYIRRHPEVRDVLISGGDPLTLSTPKLEHIISSLRAISHVEVIRIGTRVPVVLPMRIDDELVDMLKKYHPLWINTHFNHPNELTPEAARACAMLADAGIPLGNQTVLLKGINDDLEVMKRLVLGLVRIRVRPYYLYQCDLSRGLAHFRTPVNTGIEIIHGLQGFISGFAVPKYVIDSPGGGGKVPVSYNYVRSLDDREVVLENYAGKIYRYPQPSGGRR